MYAEPNTLAGDHPHEPELRIHQDMAVFGMTHGKVDPGFGRSFYADLKAMVRAYPDDPNQVIFQARGALNLMKENFDSNFLRSLYADLSALEIAYLDEPELRNCLLNAAEMVSKSEN